MDKEPREQSPAEQIAEKRADFLRLTEEKQYLKYLLTGGLPSHLDTLVFLIDEMAKGTEDQHRDQAWLGQRAEKLRDQAKDIEGMMVAEPTLQSIIDQIVQQLPEAEKKRELKRLQEKLIPWRHGPGGRRVGELLKRSQSWLLAPGDSEDWTNLFEAIDRIPTIQGIVDPEQAKENQYKLASDALGTLNQLVATGATPENLERAKETLENIAGSFIDQIKNEARFISTRYVPRITAQLSGVQQQTQAEQQAREAAIRAGRREIWTRYEQELIDEGPVGWERLFEEWMFLASANPRVEFQWDLITMQKLENLVSEITQKANVEEAQKYKARAAQRREIHERTKAVMYESFDMKAAASAMYQGALNFEILTKGERVKGVDPGADYIAMANQMYEASMFGVLHEKYLHLQSAKAKRDEGKSLTAEEEKALNFGAFLLDEDLTPNITKSAQFQEAYEKREVWQKYLRAKQKDPTNPKPKFAEDVNREDFPKDEKGEKAYREEQLKRERQRQMLKDLQRQKLEMNLEDNEMSARLTLTAQEELKRLGEGIYSPVEVRVYKALQAYAQQKIPREEGESDEAYKEKFDEETYKIRRAIFFARAHNATSLRLATINAKVGIFPRGSAEIYTSLGPQEDILRVFNQNRMMYERFEYFHDPLRRAEILILYKDFFKDLARHLRIDAHKDWQNDWNKILANTEEVIRSPGITKEDVNKRIEKMEEFFQDKTGIGYNELLDAGFLIRIGSLYDGTTWRGKTAFYNPIREQLEKYSVEKGKGVSYKEFALGLQHQIAESIIGWEADNFEFVDPLMKDKDMDLRSHLVKVTQMIPEKDLKEKVDNLIKAIDAFETETDKTEKEKKGIEIRDLWKGKNGKKGLSDEKFDKGGLDLRIIDQVVVERKRSILKLMAKRTPTVMAELFPQKVQEILADIYQERVDDKIRLSPETMKKWHIIYQTLMLSQGQIVNNLITGDLIDPYFSGQRFRQSLVASDYQEKKAFQRNADGSIIQTEVDRAEEVVSHIRKMIENWDRIDTQEQQKERWKLDAFLRHPFTINISLVDIPYEITDFQQMGGPAAVHRRLREVQDATNGYEALKNILNMPSDLKTLIENTHAYVWAIHGYEGGGDDENDPCGAGSTSRARRLAEMTIQTVMASTWSRMIPEAEGLFVRLADPAGETFKFVRDLADKMVSIHVKHRGARGMNWEGPDIAEYIEMLRLADIFISRHKIVKDLKAKYGATTFDNMTFQMRRLIVPVLIWAVVAALTSELQKKEGES